MEAARPLRATHFMQTEPTDISEEMRRKAKVCETIAQDKTEESLTGASCEKEMNEQEAKAWRLKSQVWVEAEAIVRGGATGQTPPAKLGNEPARAG
jgi:hypothetical protein